eukprot:jgi/Mesen1/10158/ME000076S09665
MRLAVVQEESRAVEDGEVEPDAQKQQSVVQKAHDAQHPCKDKGRRKQKKAEELQQQHSSSKRAEVVVVEEEGEKGKEERGGTGEGGERGNYRHSSSSSSSKRRRKEREGRQNHHKQQQEGEEERARRTRQLKGSSFVTPEDLINVTEHLGRVSQKTTAGALAGGGVQIAAPEPLVLADPDGHEICFLGVEGFSQLLQLRQASQQNSLSQHISGEDITGEKRSRDEVS